MRRAVTALAGTLALLAGCGGDEARRAATPATTPVDRPEPAPTAPAPAPAPVRTTPPPVAAPRLPGPSVPGTRRAYLQRLVALAAELGPAVDDAAQSGDSTAIAEVDQRIARTTKAWLASGGAPSAAAATLAAAIATARSNVETPLLADESRRQIEAARGALAQELAAR
jgi:2-oxoglutarate dehydrogenase E2 component (dihydrolipoamide succinyltransferase)